MPTRTKGQLRKICVQFDVFCVEKIFLCNRKPCKYKAMAGEVKYIFIKCQRKAQTISIIKGLIREVIQNRFNNFAVINKICGYILITNFVH